MHDKRTKVGLRDNFNHDVFCFWFELHYLTFKKEIRDWGYLYPITFRKNKFMEEIAMLIIPLPWNRSELEYLEDRSAAFDLLMKGSTQQYYLVIQDNTITWVGQGTVPGRLAYHIHARASTMNGSQSFPGGIVIKDLGNVGFLGKFSGIEDAILKTFPQSGYCVSNMKFTTYTGQKLKGKKDHYSVIEPILCLLSKHPSVQLQQFFQALGWGNRKHFSCNGTWKEKNMKLFMDGKEVSTLEVWFANFCAIALG